MAGGKQGSDAVYRAALPGGKVHDDRAHAALSHFAPKRARKQSQASQLDVLSMATRSGTVRRFCETIWPYASRVFQRTGPLHPPMTFRDNGF